MFVDKVYHINRFKNDVILIINKTKYHFLAYFDSGNISTYQRVPIVYINKNFIVNNTYGKEIEIETINGNNKGIIYPALLVCNNTKEYKFIYLCQTNKESFNGCELLMNAYLF